MVYKLNLNKPDFYFKNDELNIPKIIADRVSTY